MFNRKRLAELTRQNAELQAIIYRYNMRAFDDVDAYSNNVRNQIAEQHAEAEKTLKHIRSEIAALNEERQRLSADVAGLRTETVQMRQTLELQDYGLFDFPHPAEASIELSDKLSGVRERIKQMLRGKSAASAVQGFTYNKSLAKGRKLVDDMTKLMLRAYNAEAENCVKSVKAGNLESAKKRLERSAEHVARLGKMIDLKISPSYQRLRGEELTLAAQHLQAVKAAKEAERERKAELREQAAAERELRVERERLEKERQHYINVLNRLRATGAADEISELETALKEVEDGISDVTNREANIRAGYVYVISNVGSFGEKMVKIGLTRRLDPLDRVRELSDASVPFNFDVHALFFSDDAVGVESALHRRFADRKANLVNQRREFFLVSPSEVREALQEIDGNILEFVEKPEAEQYQQTLVLRQKLLTD